MIPRNLPALTAAAVRARWDVQIDHGDYYRGVAAVSALFFRRSDEVALIWEAGTGRLITSEVNDTQTPYAQCAALLRSTEEKP